MYFVSEDVGNVTNIEVEKAKRFLQQLQDEPFVCVVMTGDELHVYSKEVDPGKIEEIRNFLDTLKVDEHG